MKQKLYLLLALSIPFLSAEGQSPDIDSLLRLLANTKADTSSISLNYQLADKVKGYDAAKADQYMQAGYELAKSNNNEYYIAYYLKIKAELLYDEADFNKSDLYFDSAMVSFNRLINSEKERNNSDKIIAYKFGKTDCLIGKALLAGKFYHYHESTGYCLQGIALIDTLSGNEKDSYLAKLYSDIASNYYDMEDFENALKYDKLGLKYVSKELSIDRYIISHMFVADDFSALMQFDSSSKYLERVRPLVAQLNKPILNTRFHYILGGVYRKKNQWNNALLSFQKSRVSAIESKDDFQLANSNEGMAACYINLGNLSKARELALNVYNESARMNIPLFRIQSLQLLSEIEKKAGNFEEAYNFQKQYQLSSDSLKKEKTQRLMNDLEMKYQSEKNEKDIVQLQKNNVIQSLSLEKKSALNNILIGSLIALLITGFLAYRNFRNRQQLSRQQEELHQQHIRELEKDKQLVAVDSLLKGQEGERSRLAKDLHDGLGGLLSGVKFSLINIKDNLIVTPDNKAVFERSLDMLDTSINELRRVAHNMMPEMLIKFGLDASLKDYCNSINTSKLLTIKYQSLGIEGGLDKSTEIIIYRIVQELLNNIMKHAAATESFVQLIRQENRLNLIVEDNGKGFEANSSGNNNGIGWINIRSRVEYLKGQLDVHSEPGKGTLVNMEFSV